MPLKLFRDSISRIIAFFFNKKVLPFTFATTVTADVGF